MRAGRRHSRRAVALAFWVGALVLLAVPTLPAVGASPVTSSSPVSPPSAPASAFEFPAYYGDSFPVRAGYLSEIAGGASDVAPLEGMQLVELTFKARDPSFFEPAAPGSPPLSWTQIADRWGLTSEEYAAVAQYFENAGLSVVHVSADRLSLTVAGPAAAVGRAFGTEILVGRFDGSLVTFPSQPPALPAALEDLVSGVAGLSSGIDQFTLPLIDPTPSVGSTDLVTPGIARQIYSVSSLYNVSGGVSQYPTHEAIALLLWGDGYAPSDLSTFFATYYPSSFPAVSWAAYPVDGAPSPGPGAVNDPSQAPQELTLDMEWAGSLAPGVTLDAVYAPDGSSQNNYSPTDVSMIDALNEAVGLPNVRVVSMSFGTAESTDVGLRAGFESAFAAGSQHGVTFVAATGDDGGDSSACNGVLQPDYPATSSYVLSVGGTAVSLQRNLLGQVTGFSESAWQKGGGGYSTQFAVPAWQQGVPSIVAHGGRGTPDVSASSALNFLYYKGQMLEGAGTSFATPLWGGLVAEMDALAGIPLGYVSPRIYVVAEEQPTGKNGIGLMDVTTGGNCIAQATTGWDAATGWGSPSALLLYEDLTATFVNLTVTASPMPVAPGQSVTVHAVLTNRTSGQPIAGIPIEIDLAADTSVGPCVGQFASTTVSSSSQGTVSASLSVPACYLGAHAIATVTVTSHGYYGQTTLSVPVNLLGFVPALGFIDSPPYNLVAFVVIMAVAITIGSALGRPPRGRRPSSAPVVVPPGASTERASVRTMSPPTPSVPPVPGPSTPPPVTLPASPTGSYVPSSRPAGPAPMNPGSSP